MAKVILYVEDDENSVFFFKEAMKRAGSDYLMHVASDGQMAIDYLEGAGVYQDRQAYPLPRLVLLDLKLPRVMGLEVLKWIRCEAKSVVPVIIMSASESREDVAEAYRLGVNAYLVKPLQIKELWEIARMIQEFWLTKNTPPPSR